MGLQEDTLRRRIVNLGITIEQAALFADLRPQSVFSGLKGSRPLKNQDIQSLDRALQDLRLLVESAKPFMLDLRDTRKVKFLLDALHSGDLARALTPHAKVLAEEMELRCA